MCNSIHCISVFGLMIIAPLATSAIAGPCDIGLTPSPASGLDGYVERAGGQRCEGIYVSPVGGTYVELVSLTYGHLSYDLNRHGTLARHIYARLESPTGSITKWTLTWPSDRP
jgi:hypothetical protein